MSIKKHMQQFTAGILNPDEGPPETKSPAPPSRTGMTAPGALAHFSKDFNDMEREVARLKQSQGLPATISRDLLDPSPYQTRKIDENKVAELVANLTANPLSTPITVRRVGERYQIIAGHHRDAAYGVMGRKEIAGSVIDVTDAEAQRLVFYDNLLAPQLTDFEKFAGFAALRSARGMTMEQLATEAGISKTLVSYLMSFDRLAPEVFAAVEKHPTVIGATLAAKLATLPTQLNERTAQAIELLANGQLLSSNAIAWIEQKEKPVKPESTTIKSGRYNYADVVRRDKQVTIRFADSEDADAIEQALIDLLKAKASSQK